MDISSDSSSDDEENEYNEDHAKPTIRKGGQKIHRADIMPAESAEEFEIHSQRLSKPLTQVEKRQLVHEKSLLEGESNGAGVSGKLFGKGKKGMNKGGKGETLSAQDAVAWLGLERTKMDQEQTILLR